MNPWFLFSVFVLVVPVQSTLASSVVINGIKPDLGFLLVYFSGYLGGARKGLLAGAGIGLLYDMVFGGPFGMNLVSLSIAGIGSGFLGRMFLNPSPPATMALILGLSLVLGFIKFSYHQTVLGGAHFGEVFQWIILPESLYNSVVGGFLIWALFLRRFSRFSGTPQ